MTTEAYQSLVNRLFDRVDDGDSPHEIGRVAVEFVESEIHDDGRAALAAALGIALESPNGPGGETFHKRLDNPSQAEIRDVAVALAADAMTNDVLDAMYSS